MKKLITTAFLAVLVTTTALAQGWPANYGGVMLQGFFWDSWTPTPINSPRGGALNFLDSNTFGLQDGYTWATMYGAGWGSGEEWQVPLTTWNSLIAHKNEIAPFIDLLWLPQSGSTICPPTTRFNKSQDTSGRNAWRAWRNGQYYEYTNDMDINQPDCMGFVPVFYFHHGTNGTDNPWTYTYRWGSQSDDETKTFVPKSYFGTEPELRQLISEYRAAGTGAVEDVVANHRGCFGTWNFVNDNGNITYNSSKANLDFPEEDYTGQFAHLGWDAILAGQTNQGTERIAWDLQDVCSDDESAGAGGNPQGGWDCGGKGEWARDIQHHNPNTRAKVVKYLDYLRNSLGYLGFRYDYAMGFEGIHYAEYNSILRPPFSVGEYWGSQTDISGWIASTYMNGANQSAAFDFPLMSKINEAFNDGHYRWLRDAGLIGDHDMRRYAVTFVDNHDTFKDLPTDGSNYDYQHRTNRSIEEANAFILAMPGTPCLFYPHFMHPDWHDHICNMIKARRAAGVHNMSEILSCTETGNDGITWIVEGTHGNVCLQLGDAAGGDTPQGYQEVFHTSICRYSITSGLDWQNNVKDGLIIGYPIVSRGTCAFSGSITINVKPSLNGVTLVYTTDGTEPTTATQDRIIDPSGENLTFTETTQLKVGVIAVNKDNVPSVQSVQTFTYAKTDEANSVTIYVKADDAPNLYLWNNNNTYFPNGAWAGEKTDQIKTIKGVNWHCKTFPLPDYNNGEYYNLIINWNGNSQSHTISGITSDRFFTYANGQPIDVTNDYISTLLSLKADKEAGVYDGDVDVNLTASDPTLTIVYTTNGSAPTASSSQLHGSGTVKITGAGTHVLRAALLVDGQVMNEITRTYVIENVATNGTRIFVRATSAPHLFIYNAVTSDQGSANWPGMELTQTVQDEDGYTWYYYENENLQSCDIVLSNGNSGASNQTENIYGVSGDCYYVFNGSNYYLDVTNLVHNSYILFQPSKSTWDKDGAAMQLFISGVGDFMSFTKIGGTNGGDNVYLWYSDDKTVVNGTEICFKRMSGTTQWNWSSSNDKYPSEGYIKGGYYYNDLNEHGGWDNSVKLGADNYNNFKYPSVTHKIGDINEGMLYEIENGGNDNVGKFFTVSENLTVGYVDADNSTVYAYNASTRPTEQVPALAIDYMNTLGHATAQRDWVKITGFDYISDFNKGDVLSNVTGEYTDAINPTLRLVVDPIKASSGTEELNTYSPCNFQSSQTQVSDNGNTYFFFRPQACEVAHIMGAIYKGNGTFEVPTRQTLPGGTTINGAGLSGTITVNLDGVTGYNAGSNVYEFDALITRNGGGSGAPRRIAGDGNYTITALTDGAGGHDVSTDVVEKPASTEVASVRFMNLAGQVSSQPFTGLNIVVTTMTDGSVTTKKVFK